MGTSLFIYIIKIKSKNFIDSQSDRQDGAVGTEKWSIPTIHILGMVEWTINIIMKGYSNSKRNMTRGMVESSVP
jgi:hypothetical protein